MSFKKWFEKWYANTYGISILNYSEKDFNISDLKAAFLAGKREGLLCAKRKEAVK